MKKILSMIAAFLILVMLTACNQTAKTENEPSDGNNTQEAETNEKNKELTLQQVLKKTIEASESLNSFSVKMNMDQQLNAGQQSDQMNLKSVINMDVTTKPMAFYQKMNMTMEGSEESFDTESYFTEEGMYFYDAAGGKWMKFPKEMSDQLVQLSGEQSNPAVGLKKLQENVEDLKFEQDGEHYMIKLKASGDKFNDFIKKTVQETLPPQLAENEGALENMKINAIEYEFQIDKKTFYPTILNMMMDMEISAEGQTIKMLQNLKGEYSDYNTINKISVPQDVIENAVEIEM